MRTARVGTAALVIAAAVGALLASSADAAIRVGGPTRHATIATVRAPGNVVSDGERYVAFTAEPGQAVALFDSLRRRRSTTQTTCPPVAGVSGVFLTGCNRLLDPRTRRTRPVRGARASDNLYQLGTHWVAGEVRGSNCDAPRSPIDCTIYVAINWRTGERHECSDRDDTVPCPDYGWDLNARTFRAWRHDRTGIVGAAGRYLLEDGGGSGLFLAGGPKRVTLSTQECCTVSLNPMISIPYVTWTERVRHGPVTVFGYDIATRQRWGWAVRGAPRPVGLINGDRIRAWHTRYGVVVQVLTRFKQDYRNREATALTFRLFFAPWPAG
ncbi:MAG: hypothetical protein ACJ76Z_17040 [Thermoleophilaceae bacterium]